MSDKKKGRSVYIDQLFDEVYEKLRMGESINMEYYLSRLPNEKAKKEFRKKVNGWMLLRTAVAFGKKHVNS